MSLQGVSHYDQSSITNTLPNQRRHNSICLNRQREKTPVWEQDYLLIRKIVKAAVTTIACMGVFYCIAKMAYLEGVAYGKQQGQDNTKQEALDRITQCLNFHTTEDVMDCVKRQISWI